MPDHVAKYDQLAGEFAAREYANLPFYMERQLAITRSWGTPLRSGDSVLELGCGDGYLAQLFVQHGFRYCGVDISPRMVDVAQRRLQEAGQSAGFFVADVNLISPAESYDLLAAYMRTFFAYVRDPITVLKRLRPFIRKKLIIDLNPRQDLSLGEAIDVMRQSGFRHISWRPFFVPMRKQLPVWLLNALVFGEVMPLVRGVPLRWKFHVLLKGEP